MGLFVRAAGRVGEAMLGEGYVYLGVQKEYSGLWSKKLKVIGLVLPARVLT